MGKNNKIRRAQKKLNIARKLKAVKKKQIAKDNLSLGPVFHKLPNPFAHLNDEQRIQVIRELAQNSENKYQEALAKIKEILIRYDPISMLAILASYGLTVGVSDNGIQNKDSDHQLLQFQLEICQALALQFKPEELQNQPVLPEIVQELWTALSDLKSASHFRGIQHIEDSLEQEGAVKELQRMMRSNTQLVRNWGYFSQVKSISHELYGHFNELLEKSYGFSCSNVITLFQLLIDEIELANTERRQSLSGLYKIKNKAELVMKYHELIDESPIAAEQFIQSNNLDSISIKSLFLFFLSHHDLQLYELYKFSPAYLAKKLEVDEIVVKKVLEAFSYELGALEDYETEYLYLSNPIWLRPIIKTGADRYFCALPQVFFSFVLPSLDRLIENIDKTALSERRATYLEDKIAEIINKRFPESNTVTRLKWKLGNVEYETDLIAFIDSHAVIVEAKAGKVSDPALRGAPDRLRKHIEELLVSPNIQSKRLKNRLEELIAHPEMEDDLRKKLPVDINTLHKIIRVSVSLEDFGSIQANVAQLRKTGWLPETFEPCPTMNLADFETLFDFLDSVVTR